MVFGLRPPTQRTRSILDVWIEQRERERGQDDLVEQTRLLRQVGRRGESSLLAAQRDAFSNALDYERARLERPSLRPDDFLERQASASGLSFRENIEARRESAADIAGLQSRFRESFETQPGPTLLEAAGRVAFAPLIDPESLGGLPAPIRREGEFIGTPLGAATTALFPGVTALGAAGGVAAGFAGEALEDVGVPGPIGEIAQIAGNILTPGAGLVRGLRLPKIFGAADDVLVAEMTELTGAPAGALRTRAVAGAADEPFAGALLDFDTVASEVVTSDNPIIRVLVARTGINPSVLHNTDVGKAVTAYYRQRVAAEQLTDVAISSALDVHRQPFTGTQTALRRGPQALFSIAESGTVKNVTAKQGASLQWNDVFSHPENYTFTPGQQRYHQDFTRVIEEMESLRVLAGLDPLPIQGTNGLYIPRVVRGVRGVDVQRPTNKNLLRSYEEAQEGVAAGIRYESDPRAVLELHTRRTYNEINEHQFSQHIERLNAEAIKRGERLFVTAKELVPEPVLRRISNATVNRLAAERLVNAERAAVVRSAREIQGVVNRAGLVVERARARLASLLGQGGARAKQKPLSLGTAISGARKRVAEAEVALSTAKGRQRALPKVRRVDLDKAVSAESRARLASARTEYNAAKLRYQRALDRARRTDVAPGNIFGVEEDIPVTQWRNRFFREEDAQFLREGIEDRLKPAQRNWLVRGTETLGNTIRFLSAVGDFAEPFIQGLPTLAFRPGLWAKATARHYQAFFDPTVQARFIKNRLPAFKEMAAHGTPIGDPEFFAALRPGGGFSPGVLLKLLPKGDETRQLFRLGGKQTFGRFQASYNAGLGANRALLTESLENVIKNPAERQAFIRNMTGGLDSRALGLGPTQRAIEGMWLGFSPRLIRSTFALAGDLRRGIIDPRGRASWEALTRLAAGATGIYVLTGLALGKSWDEIEAGLNPLNGKQFMSHQINGDWIGIGGQIRAITQVLAESGAAVAKGEVGGFAKLNIENPIVKFWMFRGAPGFNIAGGVAELAGANVLPFDEVDSVPDLFQHLGTSALPFALQGYLEGEQPLSTAAALVGARTSPERDFEREQAAIAADLASGVLSGTYDPTPVRATQLDARDEATFNRLHPELLKSREEQQAESLARGEPFARMRARTDRSRETLHGDLDNMLTSFQAQFLAAHDTAKDGIKAFWDAFSNFRVQRVGVIRDNEKEFADLIAELDEREPNSARARAVKLWFEVNQRHSDRFNDVQWEAYELDLARSMTEQQIALAREELGFDDHRIEQIYHALQASLQPYYDLPRDDETRSRRKPRQDWRRTNPEGEAALFLLGKIEKVKTARAREIAETWSQRLWGVAVPVEVTRRR